MMTLGRSKGELFYCLPVRSLHYSQVFSILLLFMRFWRSFHFFNFRNSTLRLYKRPQWDSIMNHSSVMTKDYSRLFHILFTEKRMRIVSILLISTMIRSDSYRIPSKSFKIRILIPQISPYILQTCFYSSGWSICSATPSGNLSFQITTSFLNVAYTNYK